MSYGETVISAASGTYSLIAGNVLRTNDTTDRSYCIQGNTLHLMTVDPSEGNFDLVATK
jgi:hypothetical protein